MIAGFGLIGGHYICTALAMVLALAIEPGPYGCSQTRPCANGLAPYGSLSALVLAQAHQHAS